MFTEEQDFFDFLEYKICEYLNASHLSDIKGFWCDGVVYETMGNNETAICTAYTGSTGQTKYKLLLKLGKKSLSLISKGRDIRTCFPEANQTNAFHIDTQKKIMQIYLK